MNVFNANGELDQKIKEMIEKLEYITANPEIWNEDIGEEQPDRSGEPNTARESVFDKK